MRWTMANNLDSYPLYIDTVGSGGVELPVTVVDMVVWAGATTAGHAFSIVDEKGRVKAYATARGAGDTVVLRFPDGGLGGSSKLVVKTLQSGVLLVY